MQLVEKVELGAHGIRYWGAAWARHGQVGRVDKNRVLPGSTRHDTWQRVQLRQILQGRVMCVSRSEMQE